MGKVNRVGRVNSGYGKRKDIRVSTEVGDNRRYRGRIIDDIGEGEKG